MINPDDNNLEDEEQNNETPIENLPYDTENPEQQADINASDLDRLKQAYAASEASYTLDVDKGLPEEPVKRSQGESK